MHKCNERDGYRDGCATVSGDGSRRSANPLINNRDGCATVLGCQCPLLRRGALPDLGGRLRPKREGGSAC